MAKPSGFDQFDDFIIKGIRETRLPSVSAGLIEGGKLVHTFAHGPRDIVSEKPATAETLYGVGSITKSFTAIAVAKLVEEGKLNLDDRIADHLPLKAKAFGGVEIHHLLSHTSGIPGLGLAEAIIFPAIGLGTRPLPVLGPGDIIPFLDDVDDWVESRPGQKLFYWNEGYYLLGRLISKLSGRPYTRYIEEEILNPLGMKRSYFSREQIESDGNLATPYVVRGEKTTTTKVPYDCEAAGGLVTSVTDLSRFVIMMANGGELEDRRLVDRSSLEKMETPYAGWPWPSFPGEGYGYGLEVIPDLYGRKVVGHGGSVEVYTACYLYVPRAGIGAVAMANATGASMMRVGLYGIASLLGQDPEGLPAVRQENILRLLEGKYATYRNILWADVKRNGSFLTLSGDDIGENLVLVPGCLERDSATFFTLSGTARMTVEFRLNREKIEMVYERYLFRKA